MNIYLKRILFIIGALIYYAGTTIGFAWALTSMNMAAGWFTFLALVAHLIIVGPTVLVIILSLFGELDNWGVDDEDEIDETLLLHAVINQFEADFESQDFESMAEMIECLLDEERDNQDILYQYLGDTAQENLKEGLTVKRW